MIHRLHNYIFVFRSKRLTTLPFGIIPVSLPSSAYSYVNISKRFDPTFSEVMAIYLRYNKVLIPNKSALGKLGPFHMTFWCKARHFFLVAVSLAGSVL
jgi:hypothetical protein